MQYVFTELGRDAVCSMESFDLFIPGCSRYRHSSLHTIYFTRRHQGNVHVRAGPCQSFDCGPQTEYQLYIYGNELNFLRRGWEFNK